MQDYLKFGTDTKKGQDPAARYSGGKLMFKVDVKDGAGKLEGHDCVQFAGPSDNSQKDQSQVKLGEKGVLRVLHKCLKRLADGKATKDLCIKATPWSESKLVKYTLVKQAVARRAYLQAWKTSLKDSFAYKLVYNPELKDESLNIMKLDGDAKIIALPEVMEKIVDATRDNIQKSEADDGCCSFPRCNPFEYLNLFLDCLPAVVSERLSRFMPDAAEGHLEGWDPEGSFTDRWQSGFTTAFGLGCLWTYCETSISSGWDGLTDWVCCLPENVWTWTCSWCPESLFSSPKEKKEKADDSPDDSPSAIVLAKGEAFEVVVKRQDPPAKQSASKEDGSSKEDSSSARAAAAAETTDESSPTATVPSPVAQPAQPAASSSTRSSAQPAQGQASSSTSVKDAQDAPKTFVSERCSIEILALVLLTTAIIGAVSMATYSVYVRSREKDLHVPDRQFVGEDLV